MKKTFAFLTKQSTRIDVLASSPQAAYRKLMDIPWHSKDITTSYIEYDRDGLASLDSWRTLQIKEKAE
jgi:hypothetical protein